MLTNLKKKISLSEFTQARRDLLIFKARLIDNHPFKLMSTATVTISLQGDQVKAKQRLAACLLEGSIESAWLKLIYVFPGRFSVYAISDEIDDDDVPDVTRLIESLLEAGHHEIDDELPNSYLLVDEGIVDRIIAQGVSLKGADFLEDYEGLDIAMQIELLGEVIY